jgi:hypothetical protein
MEFFFHFIHFFETQEALHFAQLQCLLSIEPIVEALILVDLKLGFCGGELSYML